jgi:hypothetical protein
MRPDLWLTHLTAQFPTAEPVDFPYPALIVGTKTLIFIPLSLLGMARKAAEVCPLLPRPIVPVIWLDAPIPDEMPRFLWVLSDRYGLWWMRGADRLHALHRGDLPGYVPASCPEPLPDDSCVSCAFGIFPCAYHIFEL